MRLTIMNNVIQLADIRRAELDKIAAQHIANLVELCLHLASGYKKNRPKALEAILKAFSCEESEHVRQTLRELGEGV